MSEANSTLRPGMRVRFAVPLDEREALERFVVLELRGPRVLVQAQVDMVLKPQMVYPCTDMVEALDEQQAAP